MDAGTPVASVTATRLTVLRGPLRQIAAEPHEVVVDTDQLRRSVRSLTVLRQFGAFETARLLVPRVEAIGRPISLAATLKLLARAAYVEDPLGHRREIDWALLARWAGNVVVEPITRHALLARVRADVAALERDAAPVRKQFERQRPPAYLRTDVSFGVAAGGSVGHTAGVINHLGDFLGPPVVLSTDRIPTVRGDIEFHDVLPHEAFWNFRELPSFVMNDAFGAAASQVLAGRQLSCVYHRYTLNSYAALQVARQHRVPLVTEYNGSEVWVSRHWGRRLKYEALAARIENLNLHAADLVVVVSQPLAEEVSRRGVSPSRVLVNPNGVDPDRYHPAIDPMPRRRQLGLDGKTVVGFIGTFGPWHGAEVLARAIVVLTQRAPQLTQQLRFLWIGDGVALPTVKSILAAGGASGMCVFTGLVPQENGPSYLAACDILASPHVPNADGSRFFGSPTKLFEYMAMAKPIVASELEQIGEVLAHERTALLVPPGDADALAAAIHRLIDDVTLRASLGGAARREVLARYTWREHVRRTVDALANVANAGAA